MRRHPSDRPGAPSSRVPGRSAGSGGTGSGGAGSDGWSRRWRQAALLTGLLLLTGGCAPDATEPDAPSDDPAALPATLDAPVPVSAAVMRLDGVASLSVEGATAFTRPAEGGLHAVFLMDEPGTLRFSVEPDGSGAPPSATLLEVADGEDRIVDAREGWRVRFGS